MDNKNAKRVVVIKHKEAGKGNRISENKNWREFVEEKQLGDFLKCVFYRFTYSILKIM